MHHLAGQANSDLTIATSANLHALLTDAQWDWATDTLRNPRRAPARRVAALLHAITDLIRIAGPALGDELDESIAWLESLDPGDGRE